MKKNIGNTDRWVRITLAALLLNFIETYKDGYQIILGICAAVLIFTALNSFSLLYLPLKINTRRKAEDS